MLKDKTLLAAKNTKNNESHEYDFAGNSTIVAYAYDTFGRRVKKKTATSTTHFFYDGWNLVREVEVRGIITNIVEYVWGKDLSGSFQGAGGVGGLLYEKRNGAIYIQYCISYN